MNPLHEQRRWADLQPTSGRAKEPMFKASNRRLKDCTYGDGTAAISRVHRQVIWGPDVLLHAASPKRDGTIAEPKDTIGE